MGSDMSQSLEDSLMGSVALYAILDLRTNPLAAANHAFAELLQIPADRVERVLEVLATADLPLGDGGLDGLAGASRRIEGNLRSRR